MKNRQILSIFVSLLVLTTIICDEQQTEEPNSEMQKIDPSLSDQEMIEKALGDIDQEELAEEDEIIFQHVNKKYFKDENKMWTEAELVKPAFKFFAASSVKKEEKFLKMWQDKSDQMGQEAFDTMLMLTNIRIWIESLFEQKNQLTVAEIKEVFRFGKFQTYLIKNHAKTYEKIEQRIPGVIALLQKQAGETVAAEGQENAVDL